MDLLDFIICVKQVFKIQDLLEIYKITNLMIINNKLTYLEFILIDTAKLVKYKGLQNQVIAVNEDSVLKALIIVKSI